MRKRMAVCLIACLCLAQAQSVNSTQVPNAIVIKDHQFIPLLLRVPGGQKLQITVDNQDTTAEGFLSLHLARKQVAGGGEQVLVYIGPLKSGTYKYFGDHHQVSIGGIYAAPGAGTVTAM